jgi:DNA invertase Pin-like site-specific DNA recombinase
MQMRDLRAYCAARGFTIIREYIDIGQSGAKDSRPELNELMADVSCLSWKWRTRSSVKIAERTYEKRAQALHS